MNELKSMVCEIGLATYEKSTTIPRAKITGSNDAQNYFRRIWDMDLRVHECMYAIFLNRANNVTKFTLLSKGGTAGTVIDVRILSRLALDTLSHGVIICHNHPSGVFKPSSADKILTEKISNALVLFDIKLLDHIILTEDSYYSFSDEGLI